MTESRCVSSQQHDCLSFQHFGADITEEFLLEGVFGDGTIYSFPVLGVNAFPGTGSQTTVIDGNLFSDSVLFFDDWRVIATKNKVSYAKSGIINVVCEFDQLKKGASL